MKIMVKKIIDENRTKWIICNQDTMIALTNFYSVYSHNNERFYCESIDPKIMIEKFNARLELGYIYSFKTEEDAQGALEYIEPFFIMEEIIK